MALTVGVAGERAIISALRESGHPARQEITKWDQHSMPPLVYETAAWLRYYTSLPIPLLPGEAEANVSADPQVNGHAAPLAGALVGLAGALALLFAYALRLPPFSAAALALIVLAIVTGAMAQRALIVSGDQLGTPNAGAGAAYPGIIILIASVLIHMGALFALVQIGPLKAGIALIAAAAVARGAAVSFAISNTPKPEGEAPGDSSSLQKLVIVALVLGIVLIFPAYGLGSAIAGIAAAIAAAAVTSALAPRVPDGSARPLSGPVEIAAEISFLIAVYFFATV